ncbi:MAG: hypothetical protein IPM42_11860 [Saprospiraceae bacterium]|nr:hypothetical protein [Saprospiraceae bacterium]
MERTIITIIFVAVSLFVPFDGNNPQQKPKDSVNEKASLISYDQNLDKKPQDSEIIQ